MTSMLQAEQVINRWPPERLTIIYDDGCELCRRCRHWLSSQACHVELRFLATSDPEVANRYGHLPWYRAELLVVDDTGRGWVGPDAFVMCLWATRRWRSVSFWLRGTAFAPLAERFFTALSANRATVSGLLRPHRCEGDTCGAEPAGSTRSAPVAWEHEPPR